MFWGKASAGDPQEKRSLLKLFHLSDTIEDLVVERMVERSFAKGDVIVREGEAGNSLFFIASGRLLVLKRNSAGKEVEVAHMGVGEFFGEISLLRNKPRTSTVIAEEPCRLFEIERKRSFVFLIASTPELMAELKKASARRMENDAAKLTHDQ